MTTTFADDNAILEWSKHPGLASQLLREQLNKTVQLALKMENNR